MFFYKEIVVFYFFMSNGNFLGNNLQFYVQGLMFQDSIRTNRECTYCIDVNII